MDDEQPLPRTDLAALRNFYVPPPDADPRPPYQFRNCSMLYVGGRLDPELSARVLPPGLHPVAAGSAHICIYDAPEGWGLTPFKAFYTGIDVQGHDAGDGSPGVFLTAATYSDRAGEVIPRDFSPQYRSGPVSLTREGDRLLGHAEIGEAGGSVTVSARLAGRAPAGVNGMINFMTIGHGGGLLISTNSHSFLASEVETFKVGLDLAADDRLAYLRGLSFDFAIWINDCAFTMGAPAPLGETFSGEAARLAFLDALARLGRPVGIVETSGRIVYLNSEAQDLLRSESGALPARLPAPRAGGAAMARLTHPMQTGLLPLPSGRQVLARAFPIALRLGQGPLSMVLLTDPRAPGRTDPEPLLRLMGLTGAEAALAALVGQGLSPAEAAARRGITQSTARSMLKAVYGKLGLRRQAELARIVARLQDA